jgi:lincosamide nucleotidyltransferase A/C/D/E
MSARDVLAFLERADELGVGVWIAGSWAADALLGEQTRWHDDLDVAVEARDAATLVADLKRAGFEPAPEAGTTPWHRPFLDAHGRAVDLHLIEFTADGSVCFGPEHTLPPDSLGGHGTIAGRPVRCLTHALPT